MKYFKSWETWMKHMVKTNDPRLAQCGHPHIYYKDVYGWCALCRAEAVRAEDTGEIKMSRKF